MPFLASQFLPEVKKEKWRTSTFSSEEDESPGTKRSWAVSTEEETSSLCQGMESKKRDVLGFSSCFWFLLQLLISLLFVLFNCLLCFYASYLFHAPLSSLTSASDTEKELTSRKEQFPRHNLNHEASNGSFVLSLERERGRKRKQCLAKDEIVVQGKPFSRRFCDVNLFFASLIIFFLVLFRLVFWENVFVFKTGIRVDTSFDDFFVSKLPSLSFTWRSASCFHFRWWQPSLVSDNLVILCVSKYYMLLCLLFVSVCIFSVCLSLSDDAFVWETRLSSNVDVCSWLIRCFLLNKRILLHQNHDDFNFAFLLVTKSSYSSPVILFPWRREEQEEKRTHNTFRFGLWTLLLSRKKRVKRETLHPKQMFFHFHPPFLCDSISFSNRSVLVFPSLSVHRKEIRENEIKKEGVLELPSYFTFFFIAFSAILRLFSKKKKCKTRQSMRRRKFLWRQRGMKMRKKLPIEFTISMSWIAWELREDSCFFFFLSHLTSGFEVTLFFFGISFCFRLLRFLFRVFLFFIHIRLYFRFADFLFILRHRMCLICQCLCTLLLLLLCYSSLLFFSLSRKREGMRFLLLSITFLLCIPFEEKEYEEKGGHEETLLHSLQVIHFLSAGIILFIAQILLLNLYCFLLWVQTRLKEKTLPFSLPFSLYTPPRSKIHWKMKKRVSRMRKMIWKQERRLKDKNVFLLNANPFMFYFPHFHLHLISCPRHHFCIVYLLLWFLPLFHSFYAMTFFLSASPSIYWSGVWICDSSWLWWCSFDDRESSRKMLSCHQRLVFLLLLLPLLLHQWFILLLSIHSMQLLLLSWRKTWRNKSWDDDKRRKERRDDDDDDERDTSDKTS